MGCTLYKKGYSQCYTIFDINDSESVLHLKRNKTEK